MWRMQGQWGFQSALSFLLAARRKNGRTSRGTRQGLWLSKTIFIPCIIVGRMEKIIMSNIIAEFLEVAREFLTSKLFLCWPPYASVGGAPQCLRHMPNRISLYAAAPPRRCVWYCKGDNFCKVIFERIHLFGALNLDLTREKTQCLVHGNVCTMGHLSSLTFLECLAGEYFLYSARTRVRARFEWKWRDHRTARW